MLTSSILSTITLNELTGSAKIVASDTFRPFEVYAVLLIVYAALTYLVSLGIGVLHRRLNRDRMPEVALMRYTEFHAVSILFCSRKVWASRLASSSQLVSSASSSARSGRSSASTACRCLLRSSPSLLSFSRTRQYSCSSSWFSSAFPAFFHLNVTPVEAAMITLSANTAAFIYVIAVSAIESIGRDQIEAARVFGLSRWQVLRHIIAPAGGGLLGRAA